MSHGGPESISMDIEGLSEVDEVKKRGAFYAMLNDVSQSKNLIWATSLSLFLSDSLVHSHPDSIKNHPTKHLARY